VSGKSLKSVTELVQPGALLESQNSGGIEFTFSAPFYTGVFLSSRELQGDYEYRKKTAVEDSPTVPEDISCPSADLERENGYVSHQKMVIKEMEKKVSWGWCLPPGAPNCWDRTVSPSYFIGCSLTEEADIMNCLSKIEEILFNIEKVDLLIYKIKTIDVKFYEFGFGSVRISFKEIKFSESALYVNKDHENWINNFREAVQIIFMNPIVKEATEAYCGSVPCCIKNSDIWDIDNFGALEVSEAMCRVGKIQEISTVVTLEKESPKDFNRLQSELEKNFLHFSKDLHKVPYNATYKLFTDGENITIALGKQKKEEENKDILFVTEVMGVNLAVGRYFNNFFYSYFNYASSEYEAIISRKIFRTGNINKLRNLFEKFFDCKTMYSQICHQTLENSDFGSNFFRNKLFSLFPQHEKVQTIWSKSNKLVAKVTDMNNQIDAIKSQYSASTILNIITVALGVQIIGLFIVFVLELAADSSTIEKNVGYAIIFYSIFYAISLLCVASISGKTRKLYYIKDSQEDDYKNMYRHKEKRNKNRSKCTCEVNECHRCKGIKWHRNVFYRSRSRCFRCNDRCGERHEKQKMQ